MSDAMTDTTTDTPTTLSSADVAAQYDTLTDDDKAHISLQLERMARRAERMKERQEMREARQAERQSESGK